MDGNVVYGESWVSGLDHKPGDEAREEQDDKEDSKSDEQPATAPPPSPLRLPRRLESSFVTERAVLRSAIGSLLAVSAEGPHCSRYHLSSLSIPFYLHLHILQPQHEAPHSFSHRMQASCAPHGGKLVEYVACQLRSGVCSFTMWLRSNPQSANFTAPPVRPYLAPSHCETRVNRCERPHHQKRRR